MPCAEPQKRAQGRVLYAPGATPTAHMFIANTTGFIILHGPEPVRTRNDRPCPDKGS